MLLDEAKKKGKVLGRDVVWVKPSWLRREYQLIADGDPIATLRFSGMFSNEVTVYGLGEQWVFNRKGFFRQEIVTENEYEGEVSRPFRYRWTGGGTLYLDDGDTLQFKHGFWGSKSYWQTSSGIELITFVKRSWWRSQVAVEFNPYVERFTELPVLVFLGFYLRILHEQDSTAAVAAGG